MKSFLASIFAIMAIVGLELYALHLGHNGICLTASIACISGLGGYNIKKIKDIFKGNNGN
jgi:hypothetical protein